MIPPFGLQETRFPTQPRSIAPDDFFHTAMSVTEDAENAQVLLGTKYIFDCKQWLSFFKRAETQNMKVGLRCVIQIGTIFSCLSGRYLGAYGEVKLCKARLFQSVAKSKLYQTNDFNENRPLKTQQHYYESESNDSLDKDDVPSPDEMKLQATLLSGSSNKLKIMVIEGDTLQVAIQIRRIFRVTPLAMIPINPAIPLYRRGGPSPEEDFCRRTNLWDCLQDPYEHSGFNTKPAAKGSSVSLNSIVLNSLAGSHLGSSVSIASSLLAPTRMWKYPISDTSCIYIPNITVMRDSEREGYAFLNSPSVTSCKLFPKLQKRKDSVWNGEYGNKELEPRMTSKGATAYAKKIELILNVAIREQHRLLVLGAFGCGAHGTPPRHAAEIFQRALRQIDPNGMHFDLVAFAILEDTNSFKPHNPNGNTSQFAAALTSGKITQMSQLHDTPAINETIGEFEARTKPPEQPSTRKVQNFLKPIIKRNNKPKSTGTSRETLVGSSKESLDSNCQIHVTPSFVDRRVSFHANVQFGKSSLSALNREKCLERHVK
ncbi:hypothetical protein BDR26DRAFT_913926 [Obelidium mucronatum]|nr:hypothetical protein BDR26DRAFT_913926 [Obelidium mucronatum]